MNRAEQYILQIRNYDNEIASRVAAKESVIETRPTTNVGNFDFDVDEVGRPTIQDSRGNSDPTPFDPRRLQDWLDHWFGNYKEPIE